MITNLHASTCCGVVPISTTNMRRLRNQCACADHFNATNQPRVGSPARRNSLVLSAIFCSRRNSERKLFLMKCSKTKVVQYTYVCSKVVQTFQREL